MFDQMGALHLCQFLCAIRGLKKRLKEHITQNLNGSCFFFPSSLFFLPRLDEDYFWQLQQHENIDGHYSVVYHIGFMHGHGRDSNNNITEGSIHSNNHTAEKTTPLRKCLLPSCPLTHTDRLVLFALTFTRLRWYPETDWKRQKAWLRRKYTININN